MKINDSLLDIESIKRSRVSLQDLFIRRTAVVTSIPESLVELVIKDQWAHANRTLGDTTNISEVDFPNLGTFSMSPSKARKRVAFLEGVIKKYQLLVDNGDPKKVEGYKEILENV